MHEQESCRAGWSSDIQTGPRADSGSRLLHCTQSQRRNNATFCFSGNHSATYVGNDGAVLEERSLDCKGLLDESH